MTTALVCLAVVYLMYGLGFSAGFHDASAGTARILLDVLIWPLYKGLEFGGKLRYDVDQELKDKK
jgi:hypothetical protein